ncbi:DUF2442 domain-containing protein [Phormidesmis priestleyi ULC007]|uniref:DUF2442 domain-containing protein n=1 Tax=Phormidesmis priestleyi ULC007 TaxID=1920490 RepID=A0A2T1D606_9CYAN|nr:DUF2442 domain-containing protein [Phormidesmis priestleyi]PSB15876.1 DUF2442 domain-containing protein [Phormidesmis priestleyi ULC007]PZO53511.1 MAG: DUF2442 domain-containing protein [Phormidesmis priestleyi]
MLKDIISAHPISPYQIHLRFEDGIEGTIDLTQIITFSGIFAPLQDPAYFATVRVNPDLGTIVWDNGADLDPDVLYAIVTQQPIPDYTDLQPLNP